jgi:PhzF family phenazine biosynthesis protein
MSHIEAHIWNAFTHNGRGGNPAGIVVEDKPLKPVERQRIARELDVSETAFVRKLGPENWQLRFHTPTRAIARCGHATVAAFSLLAVYGEIAEGSAHKVRYSQGQQSVRLQDKRVWLALDQAQHRSLDKADQEAVHQSLGLAPGALAGPPIISGTGNDFILLPMLDVQSLRGLSPDFTQVAEVSRKHNVIGYYAYLPTAEGAKVQAATRMFAPAYGINEEAATGMAAGALAAHMRHREGKILSEYQFSQGILMPQPSPSRIFVRHAGSERLEVGGYAAVGSLPPRDVRLA